MGGSIALEISSQKPSLAQQSTDITIEQATTPVRQAEYELKDWVEIVGTPLSIIIPAFGGIFAYLKNESWKHRQYIENKIKDFDCKAETINIRKLLSHELQCVELFPFESRPVYRYVIVEDCLWAEALLECKCNQTLKNEFSSIDKKRPLYTQEAAVKSSIRDNFNRFLNYLQHFEKMIEAGAMNEKQLEAYIHPWIKHISQANESVSLYCSVDSKKYTPREALLTYMGLREDISDECLSVVQKDIRRLFSRYTNISLWERHQLIPSIKSEAEEKCSNPVTA